MEPPQWSENSKHTASVRVSVTASVRANVVNI